MVSGALGPQVACPSPPSYCRLVRRLLRQPTATPRRRDLFGLPGRICLAFIIMHTPRFMVGCPWLAFLGGRFVRRTSPSSVHLFGTLSLPSSRSPLLWGIREFPSFVRFGLCPTLSGRLARDCIQCPADLLSLAPAYGLHTSRLLLSDSVSCLFQSTSVRPRPAPSLGRLACDCITVSCCPSFLGSCLVFAFTRRLLECGR